MISKGKSSYTYNDIKHISESEIVSYYLGVTKVPMVINSPLRKDNNPSFALYSPNGTEINYIDFSTRDKGRIFTLLKKMWNIDYRQVFQKIYEDFSHFGTKAEVRRSVKRCRVSKSNVELKCKVRDWSKHDIEYWESFGISLEWLKYADIYPISHKIIIKDGTEYVFKADKYAYAYVEFKDNKTTLKIYQPFNKEGFKWSNSHDRSVLSLWTKIPERGKIVCICSSMKDALCLWANTGIPAIALQGEGYGISKSAIVKLKNRYDIVNVLLDNDKAGLEDSKALCEKTGFTNIILPRINGAKDISDLYKSLEDKTQFKRIILNLFKPKENGTA